jgi:hypothetical protein
LKISPLKLRLQLKWQNKIERRHARIRRARRPHRRASRAHGIGGLLL